MWDSPQTKEGAETAALEPEIVLGAVVDEHGDDEHHGIGHHDRLDQPQGPLLVGALRQMVLPGALRHCGRRRRGATMLEILARHGDIKSAAFGVLGLHKPETVSVGLYIYIYIGGGIERSGLNGRRGRTIRGGGEG
ncbi:hypothetical protein CRG98_038179 [Punica granatum]|uniref:Uncharacterized protein n=1 Tax=Punica granatum TaxID=22663 RepID=A0A2I0IBN6_PUNGR|nr:hypothetical protein CRG98_038179 [Punica granatum]